MQPPSVQQPLSPYPIIPEHGPVRTVAFFPDGRRIVTGGHRDSSTRIWDLETGVQDGEPLLGHSLSTLGVAVSKRGTDVVTGGADNKVFLWDVDNRKAGKVLFAGPSNAQIRTVAFNFTTPPTLVASSGSSGIINVWELKPDMDPIPRKRINVGDTPVSSIQFSPGYPNLIAVASFDKKARIYNAYNGELQSLFDGHTTFISSLSWLPGGQRLVSGGDKSIWIWGSRTGEAVDGPLLGHSQLVKTVSISPQGRFVASGSNDRTLRLWNAVTREQVGSPITHPDPVNIVFFSPDGKTLLSVTEKGVIFLWDTSYLEVEEGLQLTRGVIDDLVSFSAEAREEIRELVERRFRDIREEHAAGVEEQQRLFEEKVADDERRFDELQDLLNEVKFGQQTQLLSLKETLDEVTRKQEEQAHDLQRAISRISENHQSEFHDLREAQKGFSSKQEAKFDEIQEELRSLKKMITVLGQGMKKAFPAALS